MTRMKLDERKARLLLYSKIVRKPGMPAPKAFSTVKRMSRQQVRAELKAQRQLQHDLN